MSEIELQARKHPTEATTGESSTTGSTINLKANGGAEGKGSISGSSRIHTIHANIQFAALCWCLFLGGWNDGTTGPLLPRIQKFYGVLFEFLLALKVLN
jgi:hypothetical protein